MKKIMDLNDETIGKYLNSFYECFETGYAFEEFLKVYLDKIGFDEVSVTQRSRDGGYDLKAIRKGIGDFSNIDDIEYYIQAKRYNPLRSIPVRLVRELKGTIPFGNKGMFITTAKFSQDAKNETINDPSKPVILVDGFDLIQSCIDMELGFVYEPIFSKQTLQKLLVSYQNPNTTSQSPNVGEIAIQEVSKLITNNDIRARIISIPRIIINQIPEDASEIKVVFNNSCEKTMPINRQRNYLARTTEIFKRFGLIETDGSFIPKKATWIYNNNKLYINIE